MKGENAFYSVKYFKILFQDQPDSERPDPLALRTAAGEGELAKGAKSHFFSFCSKYEAKSPFFQFSLEMTSLC